MKDVLDEAINGKICQECGGRIIFGISHICSLRGKLLRGLNE